MKLQFDAKQPYQIEAVDAVVALFDGQPLNKPDYPTIFQTFDTELFGSVAQTELGIGNRLFIDRGVILKQDDTVLYLVRETKSTKQFEKPRNAEAVKVRCGRKHFEAIGAN